MCVVPLLHISPIAIIIRTVHRADIGTESFDPSPVIREVTKPKSAPETRWETSDKIPISEVGFSESEEKSVKINDIAKNVSMAAAVSINITSTGFRL